MKRRVPLPRGRRRGFNSTLRPGGPLRQKGGSRFPKLRDPAYCAWVRERGCVLRIFCQYPVEAHHVRTRAAGGEDIGNVVGLCRLHHAQFHAWGRYTFEARHQIDLKAEALRLAERYAALPTPARGREP